MGVVYAYAVMETVCIGKACFAEASFAEASFSLLREASFGRTGDLLCSAEAHIPFPLLCISRCSSKQHHVYSYIHTHTHSIRHTAYSTANIHSF